MKSIAIVTHDMFGGGCERVIAQLANWFVTQKIKGKIVTEYKAPCFYDLCQEVQIISLSDKDRFSSKDILASYYKLRKKMIALQPDVILAMPEKVNVWDDEFKAHAVSLVVDKGRSISAVATDLGASRPALRRWVRLSTKPEDSVAKRIAELEAGNKALKKDLSDAKDTVEVLKKSVAIFTKP